MFGQNRSFEAVVKIRFGFLQIILDQRLDQAFGAPGLPIEVDGQPVCGNKPDLPAIGEDTTEILGRLGLTAAEARKASGSA